MSIQQQREITRQVPTQRSAPAAHQRQRRSIAEAGAAHRPTGRRVTMAVTTAAAVVLVSLAVWGLGTGQDPAAPEHRAPTRVVPQGRPFEAKVPQVQLDQVAPHASWRSDPGAGRHLPRGTGQ